jgi:hypothetical protein
MTCRATSGKVFLRSLKVADQPLLPVGNAQLQVAFTETKQELPDYTNPAGGNACSFREINTAEMTMTLYDTKKENMALALLGDASSVAGAAVVAEPHNAFAGGALNELVHMPTPGTVHVKVGATTYVENTDYVVSSGGYIVKAGSALETAILAGTGTPKHLAVTVDYSYGLQGRVDGITESSVAYEVVIECINKAASGAREKWILHNVIFGPAATLDLITKDFTKFEVKADINKDESQPLGESQYVLVLTE